MPTQHHALAILSTCFYFAGLASFKTAAAGMPPLGGTRPRQLMREALADPLCYLGGVLILAGAVVQAVALTRLTTVEAQPMLLAGLVMLLLLGMMMGERLTLREWGCVLLLALATALFVLARGGEGVTRAQADVALPLLAVVAVALPSLLVPVLAFLASDLSPKGVHARPLTGVALAVNAGLLIGTAELMLKGTADLLDDPSTLFTSPYLYLLVLTTPLAMGQALIALQRSRLMIVGLVATATAKTYLLVLATLLYREPWPDARNQVATALALSVLAIATVPHHEQRPPDRAVV
jgi:hypothetical protein